MDFHFITLFPNAFKSYLGESIISRAIKDKKISAKFYNPRDYTKDKHKRVDRKPYGGGPGMVLEAESVGKAIADAVKKSKSKKTKIIFFSPSGKQFTNEYAEKLAKTHKNIIFVCGRYEGIDARVKKMFKMEEVSVGPYVLTGGELPAMIVMDSVARRVKGVLGKIESLEENRVAGKDVYTRPEVLVWKGKKLRVPKVLLSGHHKNINEWKRWG
ncbi:MAG: tRNA (guanosine(37)-N1)-methyltransferase TrmD [Minisyncoccia bacterium]